MGALGVELHNQIDHKGQKITAMVEGEKDEPGPTRRSNLI